MNELALVNENWPTFLGIMKITAHANKSPETLHAMLVEEIGYMESLIKGNDQLQGCVPDSVVFAIKSSIKWNLTLDPSAGLVYLQTRNVKVGGVYQKKMTIQRSPNGSLSFARMTGRLIDYTYPEIVTDSATGRVIGASLELLLPSYPKPRWEKRVFDIADIARWQMASHKDKSRNKADADTKWYCNALYLSHNNGPDPEFIRAKAIQHSLKKLGINQNEAIIDPNAGIIKAVSVEASNAVAFDEYEEA